VPEQRAAHLAHDHEPHLQAQTTQVRHSSSSSGTSAES
jgi:hypothetical protein